MKPHVEEARESEVQPKNPKRRAVIVAGCRTPFAKAFGSLQTLDTIRLGVKATEGLLKRTGIRYSDVEAVIWGGVILPSATANVAREIALDLRLSPSCDAFTVSRACTSGLQAITLAAAAIERGEVEIAIAGGGDSTSHAEVPLPSKLIRSLAPIALGKPSWSDYLGVLAQITPLSDLLPKMPRIAERTTGQTMGQAAEGMARRYQISRTAQDGFAVQSHHKAAKAVASGRFDDEIIPVETPEGSWLHRDSLIRADASSEALSRLRPAFAKDGTLTAANSTPLTDGAAAVLLMSEDAALQRGLTPLASLRSWSYVGVDPRDQLLIGPAIAMPKALQRASLSLQDIDIVEIHEAFAAQVLCVLQALASTDFCRTHLGLDHPVGTIPHERLNPLGGSLAFGHPFAATGARIITTLARELALSGKRFALAGICAAGGLGAAAVLERFG